ncbi:hypothetical protein EAO79_12100 [Plantibacter sp. PA-3-X8]|uniref:relaxase/mobilization nuclease domain-containing protein n=1 Tax=Plantibacter sp. PA-3-X8 TaxID=2480625 RepID=UPI000F6034DA|nr:relaxase/mobilization nuclease domain-containing protein [Plantibacter sp. PA-3-X8]AZH83560.1 hypothetical protein EAO79_12100 [Plantibacter sp. PA-3-X8]
MPVVVASATRSADALINYALNDKPGQQGERYVMASGVGGLLVSLAKQQMRDVRKKWGKDRPGAFVHAYHVIESFAKNELDPNEPDAWMTAQKLGRALAEETFPGRQALVVTQRDGKTGCVHNHIVVNSIEKSTGKSLNSSVVMHSRLVEVHERVLDANGFEQRADLKQAFSDATERRERGERSGLRRSASTEEAELYEAERHLLWEVDCDISDEFGEPRTKEPFSVAVLRSSIERALKDPAATDWAGFVEAGRARAVQITQRGKNGRGISYGMMRENPDGTLADPSPSDRRRCTTLGTPFEMGAIEQGLQQNHDAHLARLHATSVSNPHAQPARPATLTDAKARRAAMDDRVRATMDEVRARLDPDTDRRVAEFIAAKAEEARLHGTHKPPKIEEPAPESLALQQTFTHISTEPTRELATESLPPVITPLLGPATTHTETVNEDPQDLLTTTEPTAPASAKESSESIMRKRKMRFPELFEDPQGENKHRGRSFGD